MAIKKYLYIQDYSNGAFRNSLNKQLPINSQVVNMINSSLASFKQIEIDEVSINDLDGALQQKGFSRFGEVLGNDIVSFGPTGIKPTASEVPDGFEFYDTTLNQSLRSISDTWV